MTDEERRIDLRIARALKMLAREWGDDDQDYTFDDNCRIVADELERVALRDPATPTYTTESSPTATKPSRVL